MLKNPNSSKIFCLLLSQLYGHFPTGQLLPSQLSEDVVSLFECLLLKAFFPPCFCAEAAALPCPFRLWMWYWAVQINLSRLEIKLSCAKCRATEGHLQKYCRKCLIFICTCTLTDRNLVWWTFPFENPYFCHDINISWTVKVLGNWMATFLMLKSLMLKHTDIFVCFHSFLH